MECSRSKMKSAFTYGGSPGKNCSLWLLEMYGNKARLNLTYGTFVRKKRGVILMVRRYYRSIFDELEDMRLSMDSLFQQMHETSPFALLPAPGETDTTMLPAVRGNLRVDVIEHDDEVVVTADVIPGVTKKDITLDLINPRSLKLSCERKEEKKEEKEGYYMRERSFGSMTRIIPLPKAVTEDGASASFKNGVLEVHLKKSEKDIKGKITIE